MSGDDAAHLIHLAREEERANALRALRKYLPTPIPRDVALSAKRIQNSIGWIERAITQGFDDGPEGRP